MQFHALFIIFEKAAKFEIVVCCKLYVALYGLTQADKSVSLTMASLGFHCVRKIPGEYEWSNHCENLCAFYKDLYYLQMPIT